MRILKLLTFAVTLTAVFAGCTPTHPSALRISGEYTVQAISSGSR